MNRNEMLTEMIKIYGFEHEVVIQFAKMVENPFTEDSTLEVILRCHKRFPIEMDEEE